MIRKSCLLLCFAMLAAAVLTSPIASIAGDSEKAVADCVSHEMAAFSSNDREAFVSTYTDAPTIVDDVKPFAWSNAGGWFDAVRPRFRQVTMTPSAPLEVLIDGNHAFIAVPFTIVGVSGKGAHFKAGGYWTGALVLTGGHSWRIASAAITLTE